MGPSKKSAGFTLIELILVIVMLGILSVVASRMLAQGFKGLFNEQNFLDADWQGQLALERMKLDIRAIPLPANITTASASQLIYTDMNGSTVTYALSSSQITRNSQILADGISGFTLSYYDKTGAVLSPVVIANIRYVTVALTITQNNVQHTLSTTVFPWNFS